MSKNTEIYLDQIADDFKFVYDKDLHKKMYESCGGNLDFLNKDNFRKSGKHSYYGKIDKKVFPDFDGDQTLETAESIFNTTGSLKVGRTYINVVSGSNNTKPFYISEDDIDVNYKFDTSNSMIKVYGVGYPMVSRISK